MEYDCELLILGFELCYVPFVHCGLGIGLDWVESNSETQVAKTGGSIFTNSGSSSHPQASVFDFFLNSILIRLRTKFL